MVSYVEREMRLPTLDTLLVIADALSVDLGEVSTRTTKFTNSSRNRRDVKPG
jgi:hypothetical protein